MSKVTVAESAGFCFGVDRAVKMVYGELEKNTKVATLGPIIHNQDVVNDMQAKGARIISSVDELSDDETVVIRSHGVGRDVYDQIAAKGNRMLDATCPFVSRIHKIVAEKSAEGYFILIAGDASHPEVQGIVGHCDENCLVFKDNFELKDFFEKKYKNLEKKLAIVAQTTYNIVVWDECLNVIPKNDSDIVIFDTICNATDTRQSDAAELAKSSDIMLVVGGRHSSNTVKLFEVCSRYCRTYHIENSDELRSLKLPAAEKIGITAGASTPAYIIKEVQTTMADNENIAEIQDEDIDFAEAIDQSFKKIHTGEKVKGIVVGVDNAEITVDLGTKHTGYVKLEDLTDDPAKKPEDIAKVGDEIELIVIKVNDAEGTAQLSKKKVDEQAGYDTIVKAYEEKTVLEGTVQHVVNKGVTLTYLGVRIFIPASHTGLPRGAELDELLKKKVEFMIIEVTEGKKRAVGSIKAVQNAKKAEAQAKFWDNANVGDVYVGKVKSLTNFGAFVDLGGIDGMVHISELSWKRIKHPSEVVAVGDTLEVYIKDLNRDENRISLGFKKAEDNPWEIFKTNYNVGDVVKATIVSITSFGAFARIIDGIDGLIHISQIADKKVENVKDILSVGDEVDVKIIDIDVDAKRISISIRALLETEENDEEVSEDDAE
ncbi:MAG: bifunctional 4-hydroxy-3-methylbut-2-enyl diphosphate reductase/30S ribosomal protein S1 [Ruminococcus flavefaciens]|nr:bifunctional 4-hydroxy-3-methylbut-2-enyl diphosphate reductase/30S ribosomal protein S1 [Ruminococcus flavefaciens]MCM1361811.1 bifunctional 4-hydroxy-3-methylbut-2-enyl diphosphate reductase/30S ribosomal protein S1 [Clostridiales bacterium]MCM1435711.1 bifunctional 4-hydroxy-3-methylbut-2-enyl diphosphate reductase/30S ribosomal protein S1 [Ruminococcus flavefaciens]